MASMSISIPTHLPISRTLSSTTSLFFSNLSHLSLRPQPIPRKATVIRMGGGPRTYPGGVSKWQWKRMQAKKAKQLLKARICRERQIYEMRKRAELKAAVSELERPWEAVEKAPTLFSVGADEQVKVLADRFQKPGGFDLWTERDGPQLFQTHDGLPSARFFPKGVVHSIKPYGRIAGYDELDDDEEDSGLESQNENGLSGDSVAVNGRLRRTGSYNEKNRKDVEDNLDSGQRVEMSSMDKRTKNNGGRFRNKENSRRFGRASGALDSGQVGFEAKQRKARPLIRSGDPKISRSKSDRTSRSKGSRNLRNSKFDVYDLSLQQDGSYEFQAKNKQVDSNSMVWDASDIESFQF